MKKGKKGSKPRQTNFLIQPKSPMGIFRSQCPCNHVDVPFTALFTNATIELGSDDGPLAGSELSDQLPDPVILL
jgi:hypothetical protein